MPFLVSVVDVRKQDSTYIVEVNVGCVASTFLIGVFHILADVFPGQKRLESRDFGLVMANEED